MSRYLTPFKIALLALITVYSDSLVPSSSSIPILSFVVSHILPIDPKSNKREDTIFPDNALASIKRLEQATMRHSSAIPGRTIWDLLLKNLWAINSLDALHTFFDALPSLLERSIDEASSGMDRWNSQPPKRICLSRNSPLGGFVRRAQLEFTRLQFHDGISLWKDLILFRCPTWGFWNRKSADFRSNKLDAILSESLDTDSRLARYVYGPLSMGSREVVQSSTDDIERLLDFQVGRMQNLGNRVPQEVRSQLRKMAQAGTYIPRITYYMQFLEAWKSGDYPSSFDNLHRYFDYAMQIGEKGLYQYALLNLAILHEDFGCISEAITAIQETIAQAREKHDLPCLNYSLSWLHQFGRSHQDEITKIQERGFLGSEKEALSFLKIKAKESNMWMLLSTTLLSEAKLTLSTGGSVYQAFESTVKAAHLNITKGASEAYGSQLHMQSSIFERLGIGSQAWVCSELFLQCYASQAPLTDALRARCKLADMLGRKGRFDNALSLMDEVDQDSLRNLKHRHYWTTSLAIIKLQRYLNRDQLDAADYMLTQLQAVPSETQELRFEVSLLEIKLELRRKDYRNASTLLEKFSTILKQQEADLFQNLKAMVLKARIYDQSGLPQKGFSAAIRAASLAHAARLIPVLCEAVGAICRILVSVKEFDATVRLLEGVLPHALECEDCELVAFLFSCLADGYMGMAGQENAGTFQRKERLNKASGALDRAFDEFSRIEDIRGQCESLAKKATIMHLNGDMVLANDYSARYLDIQKIAKEYH